MLLFGIGTKGPSIMGFEDEVEQSFGRPCRSMKLLRIILFFHFLPRKHVGERKCKNPDGNNQNLKGLLSHPGSAKAHLILIMSE